MAAQILVAADDPVVVQTVSSVARAASMEPVCVPSLELARAAVTTDPPNIVVIDLSLAGSDLVPFIESLHHLNEEVELVILSLPDQVTLVVQTIRSGASDFLSKPFSNDQFAGVLRRVLNRRARRRVPIVPTAPPRVLVLEDETQKPGQAVPLLKTAGVAARAVFTVDSAWRILDAGAVDVAIVDLGAAPESRAGLFREIRIAYPAVPVIGITPATGSVPGLDTCRSEAFVLLTGTVTADTVQRAVQAASRFRLATLDRLQTRRRLDGMLAGVEHLEGLLERQQSGTAGRSLPTRDLSVRALHSLPSGVLVLDRNLLVVEANLVAERLLGINRRDLLKRPVDKLPFPPAFHKTILQTYHTGNTFSNLETELVLQGTRTVLGYAVAPMIGELGEGGVLVHFQDITAKKKLELHLRQMDRLASLGMVAAGVTAELSSPLNLARGYVDLLTRDANDGAKVRQHVEKIKAVLGRAGEISSHVQRMIHQSSPETRPCDLHVALRNVLSLLEHKLHLGSHEVEVDLTSQAPSVMGDPTEFEQLFLALICHACEASPGGGTIRVQTADLSGVVEVQIHDAGMGLPPAHVATLFDPFTGSGPGEGASGLGLAICKNIVSRFQGTIRVDSAMGKGTAFTIRLPAVGQEHRARWAVPKWPDTPVPEERGGGAGREVALMVAPAEAAVIHAWLDGAGLTVRQYSTNVQALETLPAHRDGVLIVSLDRLGLEALDFLRTIHERRLVATVVVVVESDEVQTVTSWDRVPPLRMVVRPLGREPLLQAVMLAELASGSGAGPD